jgi:hypothetical protein
MSTWKVTKFRRANGNCPVDDFLASPEVSKRDRSKVVTRVRMIESSEQLQNEWVVNYETTDLQRLKPNCQLRFLCARCNSKKQIIIFNDMLKKSKHLPNDKIHEAEQMLIELNKGLGNVEDF